MKRIHPLLFNELRTASSYIATGWLLTRTDGVQYGFTSADITFVYDGVTYTPTNSFSGSAAVSKSNLSVDNMSATALLTAELEEHELRSGLFDNASVKVFWIRPDRPQWGAVPIRGGKIGEVVIKGTKFETELRSVAQQLQQQVGDVFTLECRVKQLGDAKCKLEMNAASWGSGLCVLGRIAGEGGIGTVLKPTAYNGFWYVCDDAPNSISSDASNSSAAYNGVNGAKLSTKMGAVLDLHGLR